MFQENLRLKRKERGLSQEELASRLHVVRQTISKWEKGQSVPDAEQLIKLAVILETTVSELLGTQVENEEESNQLAKELSRINTQLAIRNHRTRRVLKIIAIALLRVCDFDFCNYGVELWSICENRWLTIQKRVVYPISANTIIKIGVITNLAEKGVKL